MATTHRLLTRSGEFDRRAIHARATALHRRAIEQGATGGDATFAHWASYCWRIARHQHDMAATVRLEAMARAMATPPARQ
jgi:hypothetical protein